MELAHVLAVVEKNMGKERFIYLDKNECWTYDLQKAKVFDTPDPEEVDELERKYEAMAWSVYREDNGTLRSL